MIRQLYDPNDTIKGILILGDTFMLYSYTVIIYTYIYMIL